MMKNMRFTQAAFSIIWSLFWGMMVMQGVAMAQNGVILYQHQNYQGKSETFTGNDPDLKDNRLRTKLVGSIRVSARCQATLYEQENYQGDSEIFTASDPNLGDNMIENDYLRSIKVSCSSGRSLQPSGVTLYELQNYQGQNLTFAVDASDLKTTPIGTSPVWSLRLSPDCQATLYERVHFQGDSETFATDDPDLGDNSIEYDSIRSLKVSCQASRGGWGASATPASSETTSPISGIVLFRKEKYKGKKEAFSASDPNLGDNSIGDDSVSSVLIPKNCKAVLYDYQNYKGKSAILRASRSNLKGTPLGNNAASSIQIFCQ